MIEPGPDLPPHHDDRDDERSDRWRREGLLFRHARAFLAGFWTVGMLAVILAAAVFQLFYPWGFLVTVAVGTTLVTSVAVASFVVFQIGVVLVALTLGWPPGIRDTRARAAGVLWALPCFAGIALGFDPHIPRVYVELIVWLLGGPLLMAFFVAWLRSPLAPLLRDVRESSP